MSANEVTLATGPVSWGVDFADAASNPPWIDVLDDIERTRLGALELGPVGYLPEDPDVLGRELARRGLQAIGSFVFEDLHDPSQHDAILDTSARACRAIAAARGTVLVIIDRVSEERAATVGRSADARRLDRSEWADLLSCATEIANLARSHGLRPAFHPHAGSYVEFEDEIDRLLSDTPLDLCFDTGHAALAGIAATAAIRRYGDRLGHLHLKDIDASVLARVHAEQLDFWSALAAGVFCPLGDGVVDFAEVRVALDDLAYSGFATIEQDRLPGSGSPVDDIWASLTVLADAGFEHAARALQPLRAE
jgi:inosose dehydratase